MNDDRKNQSDPFNDISSLRLTQNFASMLPTKKVLSTVKVRKPSPQEWIWVRAEDGSDTWQVDTMLLRLKTMGDDFYFVERSLWEATANEARPFTLYTVSNRAGSVFLWPVPLPGEDGNENPWNRSAREAAEVAKTRPIRVEANRELGAYEYRITDAALPPPVWPDAEFSDLLRLGFRDHIIDSPDHRVLRDLRGAL